MLGKKPETATKDDKGKKLAAMTTAKDSASDRPSVANTDVPPAWFHEEMEKGFNKIHSLLDQKLSTLAVSVETLLSENRALGKRVNVVEEEQASYAESLNILQQDFVDNKKKTQEEISGLKEHLDDLENRARRQNLRLIGFPEGVEGKNTSAFLQEWLPKILELEPGETIEIERAHRSLQRSPGEGGRPRALGIRLLRFTDVTKLLDAARKKITLQYGNSDILIFRDMSTVFYRKRKAFLPIKKMLHAKDISFRLLHPTNLVIVLPEGRRTFTSPVSAEHYLKEYHPDMLI